MKFRLFSGNTLYYPGCLTKNVAVDLQENYKTILSLAGVDFIMFKDLEFCCGNPVRNAGFDDDAKLLAQKNQALFKERGITKLITSCPSCYHVFKEIYPQILEKWDVEIEFVTQTIQNAVKKGKLKPNKFLGTMTFHDPCHLGRYSGIYEQPRGLIELSGAKLTEMVFTKNYSLCCGAGSGVKTNQPELACAVAKERLQMAKNAKAENLCTVCPMCYLHLKENAQDLGVTELSQLFIPPKNKND
jgi:heterodisulfide reductase subunit D